MSILWLEMVVVAAGNTGEGAIVPVPVLVASSLRALKEGGVVVRERGVGRLRSIARRGGTGGRTSAKHRDVAC